ncbi:hypothetical protein AB205_0126860 [Aquarana catesbeiana]|uniref:Uncharacterized protein n=1 Tax=Aquarana catesbeiana TaxID=8400 RepID=A0A2G9Q987_AQUCT|nr:hypothetical protein AB205_0126860 [Aquarana catesbeiana]
MNRSFRSFRSILQQSGTVEITSARSIPVISVLRSL